MSRYCFITGFLRSGTTLVEKLVHGLDGACIGAQPFPYLYHDVKRAFLAEFGAADERYPLGHLFGEGRYETTDFEAFLQRHVVTSDAVLASFTAMSGYSGWKLPALATHAGRVGDGTFGEVYRALCDRLPTTLGLDAPPLLGTKEVFCEEFIPYFLAQGVSTILVVRDIRDVITSLRFGNDGDFADADLPALHAIRQWRKSVAFALEFGGHERFELVRYEELVTHPGASLRRVANRLQCASSGPTRELRDQSGEVWRGNSSFGSMAGVSRAPVGRFADTLPRSWVDAIESLCGPEMHVLGLLPDSSPSTDEGRLRDSLRRVGDDLKLVTPGQSLEEEIDAECARLRMLAQGRLEEREQRRWFIFPRAYQSLGRQGPASF